MPLPPDLLEILRCPETGQRLRIATDEELTRLRAALKDGSAQSRSGQLPEDTISAALIREDGTAMFPIVRGIPNLIIEDSLVIP